MTDLTEQLIKENKELEKRNNSLHKLISELNEENARLKVIKEKTYNYDYLSECYSKFTKENAQLKELLKRCKRIIEIDEYVSITGAGRDILWDLLQDLKQVLGEE